MSLGPRGECLACQRISTCQETSVERVQSSYTCPLFKAVLEPVFRAREKAMQQFGEVSAIKAMMNRPQEQGVNEDGD